jgi:hypothetical protein
MHGDLKGEGDCYYPFSLSKAKEHQRSWFEPTIPRRMQNLMFSIGLSALLNSRVMCPKKVELNEMLSSNSLSHQHSRPFQPKVSSVQSYRAISHTFHSRSSYFALEIQKLLHIVGSISSGRRPLQRLPGPAHSAAK